MSSFLNFKLITLLFIQTFWYRCRGRVVTSLPLMLGDLAHRLFLWLNTCRNNYTWLLSIILLSLSAL